MRYNIDSYSSLKDNIKFYKGINGENPPVRVLTPQNHGGRVATIFPGASPDGENHPKMLMLGQVLTRNGFKVYIPRIPPLTNLDITIINIQWFTYFYNWIINSEKVDPRHILMVGISYGGGLMLRMLQETNGSIPAPKSILTFGAYSDVQSLLQYFLTGNLSVNGKQIHIPPHEWGLVVLFQNYLKNLKTNWDSTELQKAIQLTIENNKEECEIQIAKLPNFQKGIFNSIITGRATHEVKKMAEEIINNEEESIKKLSPKHWPKGISRKVFILHGAHDTMVPFTESVQLAEYLQNSELYISYLFGHKEIYSNTEIIFKFAEFLKLLQFYSKLFYHYEN